MPLEATADTWLANAEFFGTGRPNTRRRTVTEASTRRSELNLS